MVLNFRGCSGTPNRNPRAYHSGETGDPAFVLRGLRRRFPRRPLGALGFSLGGNVLLKLLAEERDGAGEVEAAAAVSVPYDLAAGVAVLEGTRLGRLYARHFLRPLRRKVRERRTLLEPFIDDDAADAARTLREFDERVTAPLHGFADADAYYAESSSGPRLGRIRTSTLLLHARDDPFLPRDALPRIKEILPGMKSPTGVPLAEEGMGALHAAVAEEVFWEVMEKIKEAGGSEILVLPVEKVMI